MPVLIICPNLRCRKILSVAEELRSKTVKCQHCQTMIRVPEKRQVEAAGGRNRSPVELLIRASARQDPPARAGVRAYDSRLIHSVQRPPL